MEQYKITLEDNGSTVRTCKGNSPFRIVYSMVKFIKLKYGGDKV